MRVAICLLVILGCTIAALADVELAPDPAHPGDILVGADRDTQPSSPPPPHQPHEPQPSPTPPLRGTECNPDLGGEIQCYYRDDEEPAERPVLTPGHVERAVRELGLPRLVASVQPSGRTLVNVPTILHTSPESFERSVTLLGYQVDVVASPSLFTWFHGDGSSQTSSQAGAPYPSGTISHTYRRADRRVEVRVDVAYTVRFRVDLGAWQTLADSIVASGPPTALRVDQAAAVLTNR